LCFGFDVVNADRHGNLGCNQWADYGGLELLFMQWLNIVWFLRGGFFNRLCVAVEKGFSSGELNSGSPRSGEFRDLF